MKFTIPNFKPENYEFVDADEFELPLEKNYGYGSFKLSTNNVKENIAMTKVFDR